MSCNATIFSTSQDHMTSSVIKLDSCDVIARYLMNAFDAHKDV
jgi:hypothetical protein